MKEGDTVVIQEGIGYKPGIIISIHKRKSKVRLANNTNGIFENSILRVVTDFRLKEEITRNLMKEDR